MDDATLAKQAHEQLLIHEGDKIKARARLEEIKRQQQVAFQQKLQAKQQRKEELKGTKIDGKQKNIVRNNNSESSPPSGEVTFISLVVKDVASIWDTLTQEEAEQIFEILNENIEEKCKELNCFQLWGKDGKYMLAAQSVEDGLNLSLKLLVKLNDKEWPQFIEKSQSTKQFCNRSFSTVLVKKHCKIKAKSEAESEEQIIVFNGPRLKVGILSTQAKRTIEQGSGEVSYSGAGPTKVDAISHLAQGGQILVDIKSFEGIDSSKLESHVSNELGSFKLDGFTHGCKLVEIVPSGLQERLKYFGQHCAQCGGPIQPKEQFFKALGSVWHVDHFKCFSCDAALAGSFLEHQGMPYCKPCYLKETASKCFACGESTVGVYITALGHYWHPNCFSCKDCGGKAVDGVNIYQHESSLFCESCLRTLLEKQQSQQ